MAKIKICGLRRLEDIEYANELLPDYIGFILSSGFRRSISPSEALRLRERLDKRITAVGVFVDGDFNSVSEILSAGIIDIVQLHGNESPQYCKKIKAPVIKALRPDSFDKIKAYEPYVDYFLFDSGTGTGRTFNWNNIPKTTKPFFLAGGLGKENLEEAIKTVKPFAVDMSSSVETDGVKDFNKMKEVINTVRSEADEQR